MATLFEIRAFRQSNKRFLHLSDPRGNYLGTVKPEPAPGITGVLDERGELVRPDWQAFRECVPHQWRKAFDRASLWYNKHNDSKPASMTLYGVRGQLLGTIYVQKIPA